MVLKQGEQVSEEELKAFVKERLAPYKYLTELPITATGMIQRFKLRELEQEQ